MAQIKIYKVVFRVGTSGSSYTADVGISGGDGTMTHATALLLAAAVTSNLTSIVEALNKPSGGPQQATGRSGAPGGAVTIESYTPLVDVWT
jgi:hypothetical protein